MPVDIEIDQFTPCLVERKSGRIIETSYVLADKKELKPLRKEGWLFNWTHNDLSNSEVYKLTVKGETAIQGLVALENVRSNYAVHLVLAESAPQNKGDNKTYDGVGGHLFAIAVKRSFELGYGGFIYFEAKNTELVRHYREKFGAVLIGRPHIYSMIIDEVSAKRLLHSYTLGE